MVKTVSVSMGDFITGAVEQLENPLVQKCAHALRKHRFLLSVEFGYEQVLCTFDMLNTFLEAAGRLFHKCYGGWDIEIDVDDERICTGRIAFVPSAPVGFAGL